MTQTFNVGTDGATFGNTDTTTLNGAIRTIDTGPADTFIINLTGNINLDNLLLPLNLPAGSKLTINGNTHTLDGGGSQRGLFVYSGKVNINDLTISNMLAQGGIGGFGGGGGGAGLGGGLFIANDSANTAAPGIEVLTNVTFFNNRAVGNNGFGGNGGFGGG